VPPKTRLARIVNIHTAIETTTLQTLPADPSSKLLLSNIPLLLVLCLQLKDLFFIIMRGEVLHLHIGQAGTQLGNSAWEL
jgi:hypothetical protein